MKKQFLLYYMILLLTGMSITGFFVSALSQNIYKNEVRHRLLTIATLFDHELSQSKPDQSQPDYNTLAKTYASILNSTITENIRHGTGIVDYLTSVADGIAPVKKSGITEARITVIDRKGNVLGESQTDPHRMENHLGRREIQQALLGKAGEDIRFSKTLGINFLYIAIPSPETGAIIRVSVPLVQLERIDKEIWFSCFLGILAGLLLTALLAFRFISTLSKPVGELIKATKEITGGNYSRRVWIKSPNELGQLADTFNKMAEELEKTVADLKDKNIKFDSIVNSMTNCFVAVDSNLRIILINSIACHFFNANEEEVLGRKLIEVIRNNQINEIMRQTIERNTSSINEVTLGMPEEGVFSIYASPIKAEDSNTNSGGIITIHDITTIKKLEQIRTDFVSNVTHELKTPLTSIRGFVETLRNGAINDPEVSAKFLEIIDIEAERLTMLINDILQLSEIENKLSDTNIGTYSLNDIIEEVISILQGSADKKGVRLITELENEISISANRDRIKQMMINLIDNAIKYNVENGTIRISAARKDGKIIISVADTGIGIAQQHLSRIFERFYRVDKGRSRNMGGTGLGLSIVKHIVNLYDGDVKVESEPGKGTEFIIQLPH